MNLIPPITITDAMFHDSSITEPSSSESNGVTALTIVDSSCVEADGTYALIFAGGSAVHVATGTYTILSNVITAVDLTYGGEYYQSAPTVATQTGDGSITATWADGSYRGAWAVGTTYSINAIVSVVANHKLYLSLQNNNVGYTPGGTGNSAWWQEYGATERWKVFDVKVGSQAADPDLITYEIDPGPIDSMAIFNLEAANVTVTMTDVGGAGDPVVWTEDTLVDDLFVSEIIKTDFPSTYLTPHLVIEIEYTGGTAKVGEIVVGLKEDLGILKYVPSVSITDYSRKEVDEFGNYTVQVRGYSKLLSCETDIPNAQFDTLFDALAQYRAVPAVWDGAAGYSSMLVFGFYKSFKLLYNNLLRSVCRLDVQGLS